MNDSIMVQRANRKETVNGPTQTTTQSSSSTSSLAVNVATEEVVVVSSSALPRIPIPRLFSRSIDTYSQQQVLAQQQHQQQQRQEQFVPSNVVHLGKSQHLSHITYSRSNPSDCDQSATQNSASLVFVHPSTISYDDETNTANTSSNNSNNQQSRNPGSVGTIEREASNKNRIQQQSVSSRPGSPPQILYSSSRIYPNHHQKQHEYEYEYEYGHDISKMVGDNIINQGQQQSQHRNGTATYPPRGSIRDVTHSWDVDVPNFPIDEIQRIKNKAHRLRTNRDKESSAIHDTPNNQETLNATTSTSTNMTAGQSVRDRLTTNRSVTPTTTNNNNNNRLTNNQWTNSFTMNDSSCSATMNRSNDDSLSKVLGSVQPPPPFLSSAAIQAEQQLRQNFHKSREQPPSPQIDPDVTINTSTDNSHSSSQNDDGNSDEPNLILHDLCGEAVSTDDIAWRNALSVLVSEPQLATIIDPAQLWTPLHICCLGILPPPTYIVRALLYIYPKATYIPDDGGRLTLHLVAASSADDDIMQMIVQENPNAIYQRDLHGLTPLHLYIRNRSVELTLNRIRILLGYTINDADHTSQAKRRQILQRRGDHLHMSTQSVDQWIMQRKSRPITNLNHNPMVHEQYFGTYPIDVQVQLRQLSQWKHSNQKIEEIESVEVQLSPINEDDDEIDDLTEKTNPAAIPLLNETQYPIHMIVQRMIIEEAFVPINPSALKNKDQEPPIRIKKQDGKDNEDDDDEEEINVSFENSRSNQTSSILRLFAAAFPEALIKRDKNGYTPLLQVMQIRDFFPRIDIIEVLIGKRNATGFEALPSWAYNLPTHTLLHHQGSTSMQGKYINPAMIAFAETGQLPLHIAAEESPTNSSLIHTIFECYPPAVLVQDARGRTPLHLCFHNYRRIAPDPKVIETLYNERVSNIVDDYGKSPFDLLVDNAQLLPWQNPQNGVNGSSSVYRKLFTDTIVGETRDSARMHNFLPRLRALPPWLRAEACATTFVQDLLVEELVLPWKSAAILFDGLLLITLISVFRLQMKEFIDQLYDDNIIGAWYTYVVYATAVGRFMARILFAYCAVSIGEFRRLCLFNVWYWIDAWAMLMSIVTSVVLYGNTSDERLLVLGTTATVLLWLSFIGYLSSWWYSMAIFTGGFLKIFEYVLSPLITAGALVIAFAQCFYTLLQLDCADAMATNPVCTVPDSYRIVYMLIRGDSLVDPTGVKQFSTEATILLTGFLTMFAIFVLAVVVTVLTASSQLDFQHLALYSYWEPLLGFTLSTGSFNNKPALEGGTKFEVKKAYLWDVLTQTLFGGGQRKGSGVFVYPMRSYLFTWIMAIFIIPVWIVLGALSLGLLWPPQLRRWLFRPSTRSAVLRNESAKQEQARSQLTDVQNEILQMKCMSYERSQKLENDIQQMKELLIMAMQE